MTGSESEISARVPRLLRVSAALSWRFVAIVAALYVVGMVIGYLTTIVIPAGIALLLAALLSPAVAQLVRIGVPRGLATGLVLIGGIAVVGGVLTFVITEFSNGLPELQKQVNASLDTIRVWLHDGPLQLSDLQLQQYLDRVLQTVKDNQAEITSGALTTAATVGELLTGFLLALFTLIFFLHDGDGIWRFLVRAVPTDVRDRADVAGRRGFASLVSYVRATALVAVVDAVGVGIGLWIVGVPLIVPLSALVFLGAFIPIIGAVITGAVAVLVALVAEGPVAALIVLAVLIGVMQLESHVLQPLLLGRAVKLHPLAVVLAITAGLVVGGIAGALLSVPLLAVLNSGIRSLLSDSDKAVEPKEVDVHEPQESGPPDTGGERVEDLDGETEPENAGPQNTGTQNVGPRNVGNEGTGTEGTGATEAGGPGRTGPRD
ncbi:putative PurR-regulated permease PerM [Saccharothrix tamanrassetensis]|uniref:Putative PurR-regulated permease PerM n=1 Tax=Saccharothrix tamanrassetensis TaxID=1051531 RepID=A0A841CX74_9PSEU|nr:AI-2E family transporter [Saccharothrix tamanrassetensis]MBB5960535.1 putative PurR-regulated permease PerM [Saccharothrix tamanrassetensis]